MAFQWGQRRGLQDAPNPARGQWAAQAPAAIWPPIFLDNAQNLGKCWCDRGKSRVSIRQFVILVSIFGISKQAKIQEDLELWFLVSGFIRENRGIESGTCVVFARNLENIRNRLQFRSYVQSSSIRENRRLAFG